jgi:hypothetical protein
MFIDPLVGESSVYFDTLNNEVGLIFGSVYGKSLRGLQVGSDIRTIGELRV